MFKSYNEFLFEKELTGIFEAEGGRKLSDKQIKYQDLMKFALAKFGAKSPGDLSTDDKKEMFNYIKDNWSKEKGDYKDSEMADKIKKAKDKGLLPDKSPAAMSDEEYEEHQEEEATKKKEEFEKSMQ